MRLSLTNHFTSIGFRSKFILLSLGVQNLFCEGPIGVQNLFCVFRSKFILRLLECMLFCNGQDNELFLEMRPLQ